MTRRRTSTALARNTDPLTSYKAAFDVERRGTAANHRTRCLEQVRKTPGRTAAELAILCGMERHVPSRRLPELRTAGEVENGDTRICTATGNMSMTWWLVFKESLLV